MSKHNEFLLKDGDIQYVFKYLEWDTSFFNRPSYILDVPQSKLGVSPAIKLSFGKMLANSFVTVKIDSDSSRELHYFLQECGFRVVDTELTLQYDNIEKKIPVLDNKVHYERVVYNDGLPYEALGSVFKSTRFHYDSMIPREKANLLWIEFIRNFKISETNHIFAARCRGEIAGVIVVKENASALTLKLCFVSVIDEFRGIGVGSGLIRFVIGHFNGHAISTETQARNTGALNFYIRNGFSIVRCAQTVYHRWG